MDPNEARLRKALALACTAPAETEECPHCTSLVHVHNVLHPVNLCHACSNETLQDIAQALPAILDELGQLRALAALAREADRSMRAVADDQASSAELIDETTEILLVLHAMLESLDHPVMPWGSLIP